MSNDPACGEVESVWDEDCAAGANFECALECPCGDCCADRVVPGCGDKTCQECVCDLDSACCDSEWDGICAARAAEECEAACSCTNCCTAREEPGCEIAACEACVCELDSFCCDELWDTGCAGDLANGSECAAVCQCSGVAACVGDCNGDGGVAVNELIIGVRINLGDADVSACFAFDNNLDDNVSIAELIQGVNANLNGCPA